MAACIVSGGAVLTSAPALADWTPGGPQFWLDAPSSMEIDPADGSLWVVDHSEARAYKFDSRGRQLDSLGGFGIGLGQFNGFSGLAIGPNGDVYGSDIGNHRIQRFTPDGEYAQSYGSAALLPQPAGIAVAADGTLYAGDVQNGLHAFAPDGTPIKGFLAAAMRRAFAVAIGHDGALWVSEIVDQDHGDRVHKIDPETGAILVTIGGFGQPIDIEVNPDGRVSVVNFNTSTIRTYAPDGTLVEETAPFPGINQIAIDGYGRLYHYGHDGTGVITMLPDPVATTSFIGEDNTSSVDAGFVAATAGQAKELIDFDGDGFDHLAAHTFTAIAPDHYAAEGVTMLGLDARSVGTQPWANSPPIGAWQQGFGQHSAEPYSFVLAEPVASFGLFLSDVEGSGPMATVHLADGRREFVAIPRSGNFGGARFVGVTAADDVITRVDIDSFGDFHIIDDVQFGRIEVGDEQAPTITITAPLDGATFNLRQPASASYTCADDGGSGCLVRRAGRLGGRHRHVGAGDLPVRRHRDRRGRQQHGGHHDIHGPAGSDLRRRRRRPGRPGPGQRCRHRDRDGRRVPTRCQGPDLGDGGVRRVHDGRLGDDAAGAALRGRNGRARPARPHRHQYRWCRRDVRGLLHRQRQAGGHRRGTGLPAPRGDARHDRGERLGFQPGATASFSGTGVTVHGATVSDPTRITLDVSVDAGAATGGRSLTVVNPDGGSVTRAVALTVTALPSVTTATPNHVRQGQSASIVLNGTGFPADFVTGGGSISFGPGVAVNTVVRNSVTRLTATVAVAPDAALGQHAVTVVNPDGGAAECAGCLAVVADPQVTGAAPAALAHGATAQVLTIQGAGFQPGATVRLCGTGLT